MTHMKDSLPFSSRILGQVLTLYILKNNAIIFLDLNIFFWQNATVISVLLQFNEIKHLI